MNELDAEFKGPLKEVVCKYVETYDHVTFAELGNHLGDRIKEPEPSASALEIPVHLCPNGSIPNHDKIPRLHEADRRRMMSGIQNPGH